MTRFQVIRVSVTGFKKMSLVLTAALFSIGLGECNQSGIHYHWDTTHGDKDDADYEMPAVLLQKYLSIYGSFRTKETGAMTIEGFVDPTGASTKVGSGRILWEWVEVANGSASEDFFNPRLSVNFSAIVYCYKDFRYQWRLETMTDYFQVRLVFRVQPPTYPELFVLNTEFSDTCEVSGCTDLSYNREPYACQPAPTINMSPSPTTSKTPLPIETRSRSVSASSPFTPAWKLLRRPRRFVEVGIWGFLWVLN
jgi:hypothetical protein